MGGRPTDGSRPLVDALADQIRAEVMTGRLEVGTRLMQAGLAADFDVSRTPVREALRRLESEGLVEVVPNRGAIVRGPTAREIREGYLVRAELEGLAAELAAEWISATDLRELEEAGALFGSCKATEGAPAREAALRWTKANDAFHEVIQRAAGNQQLRRAIVGLHRTFPRNLTGVALSRDDRLLQRNVDEHARILDAISRRDGAGARRAMTEHIRRSGEIVAQWFERSDAERAEVPQRIERSVTMEGRTQTTDQAPGALSACDGLSILITGASRGIGRVVAESLAAAGANVTLAARTEEALQDVAGGIEASGGSAQIAVADLTGPEAAASAVAQAVDRFGTLDGAFVNAGVSVDVPAYDLSEEDWRRVLDVNLSGAFFTAQAAGRAMRGHGGSIVFTSSTFAHVAFPMRSAYSVSKAGVAHMAKQLALEWAPDQIRVNAVGPTATLTDLNRERLSQPAIRDAMVARIPLGRLLEPSDLVGAVGFLLGRESAMVTGQSLLVDGGFTAQ